MSTRCQWFLPGGVSSDVPRTRDLLQHIYISPSGHTACKVMPSGPISVWNLRECFLLCQFYAISWSICVASGFDIPIPVPSMKPTLLESPFSFFLIFLACSEALYCMNAPNSPTDISISLLGRTHSSPSQNISDNCKACFPNKTSKSGNLYGVANLRSKTQQKGNSSNAYRFLYVNICETGHPMTFMNLWMSFFSNRNNSRKYLLLTSLKLKEKLDKLIRLLLYSMFRRSTQSDKYFDVTVINDDVDENKDLILGKGCLG